MNDIDLTTSRERRTAAHSILCIVVLLVGLIASWQSGNMLIGGAFVIAIAGLATLIFWPDMTTLLVVGLIYSNLPVVAVAYHGAPGFLPAVVLAILIWPLFFRSFVHGEKFKFSSSLVPLAALTLISLLGAVLSRDPAHSLSDFISFVLEGVLLYLVLTNLIVTREIAKACFWVLAFCAVIMGIPPLLQQLSGDFENYFGGLAQVDSEFRSGENAVSGNIKQSRSAGTIGEQNRFAQFVVMLLPFCLAVLGLAKSRMQQALALVATFSAFTGFALAFSRGAAVGLVLALLVGIFFRAIKFSQLKFVFVGAVLVVILFPQYLTRLSTVTDLVTSIGQGESGIGQSADNAIRGRLTEMKAAVLVFRDNPVIGVGPGMFGEYSKEYAQVIGIRSLGEGRQSHSLPLDIAAEHGILGLMAYIAIIFLVFRKLLVARKAALERDDTDGVFLSNGMFMVLTLYLTTGLFLHLSFIRYFWLILAMGECVGRIVLDGNLSRNCFLPGWIRRDEDSATEDQEPLQAQL